MPSDEPYQPRALPPDRWTVLAWIAAVAVMTFYLWAGPAIMRLVGIPIFVRWPTALAAGALLGTYAIATTWFDNSGDSA